MNCQQPHCPSVTAANILLNHFSWAVSRLTNLTPEGEDSKALANIIQNVEDIKAVQKKMEEKLREYDEELQKLVR